MELRKIARIDNDTCLLATQKRAERVFRKSGLIGTVALKKVLDAEQNIHVFWVCDTKECEAFLPLFASDCTWTSKEYTILDPLRHNDFICEDNVCYICNIDEKGASVLRLEKILYQELIESACHAQGITVGDIYPAVLSSVQTNEKYTACWINETDDLGTIFPIDFRDADQIDSIDLNSLNFHDAIVGDRICAHGIFYDVVKTPKGKLHLDESPMQVITGGGV